MKKFLTGFIACLLAVVGVFTLYGCEQERDYNGFYRLEYALYAEGNSIVEYRYDSADTTTETYLEIKDTTIIEYVVKKETSSDASRKIISMKTVKHLTLPEFQVTKESDNKEYFTNYTKLGEYFEGLNNPYKVERWTYVKVSNLPVFAQTALIPSFGDYQCVEMQGSNLVVSGNKEDCSLLLNGSLTITEGDSEPVVYSYVDGGSGIYNFENNGKRVQVEVLSNSNMLKVYWGNEQHPKDNYVTFKLKPSDSNK